MEGRGGEERERLTRKRFRKSFLRTIGTKDPRSESSFFIHNARITEFSDQSFFSLSTKNPSISALSH